MFNNRHTTSVVDLVASALMTLIRTNCKIPDTYKYLAINLIKDYQKVTVKSLLLLVYTEMFP